MKIHLYKIILPFIYMYTMLPFAFNVLPKIQFGAYYVIMLIFIVLNYKLALNLLHEILRKKTYLPIIFLTYLLVMFFSLFSPCVHATGDISYFSSIIVGILRNTFKVFFLILLNYKLCPQKDMLMHEFMENNIKAMILYVGSTVAFVVFPDLKTMWRSIISENSGDVEAIEQINYFTRYGFSGFSGFRHTLQCSICFIFNLFLFSCYDVPARKNKYLLQAFILILGNAFYGRVGLMVSLGCAGLYVLYDICIRKNISFLLFLLILFLFGFVTFTMLRTYNPKFEMWYQWSMKPVENLILYGRIGTDSSDNMFRTMSFWPGWSTFLLGDGYWRSPSGSGYYMHTDLGYMRPMLFYGVFPQILAYSLSYMPLLLIYRKGVQWRLLAFLLAFQLFIFELKGEVFYIETGIIWGCLLCLTCVKDKIFLGEFES